MSFGRASTAVGVGAAACCAVAAAATFTTLGSGAAAQGPPAPGAAETLVIPTPDGDITVTLSPDEAPLHVAAIRRTVADGGAVELRLDRVSAGSYLQLAAPSAAAWAGLPHEAGTIGNVEGAVSVYDGDADPTLLIVLSDSHHLDADYSPIGWVTGGFDSALTLGERPVGEGGVPDPPVAVGPLRAGVSDAAGAPGPIDVGSVPTEVWLLAAVALAVTGAVGLTHRRLDPRWVTALLLTAVLIGAFAVFTAVLTSAAHGPAAGLAALVLAVAAIRLMSRFEPPVDERR